MEKLARHPLAWWIGALLVVLGVAAWLWLTAPGEPDLLPQQYKFGVM